MSAAAAVEVKGWCPGVLQPMQSGDGLLVRVRPWCGAIGLPEAKALAEAAARFGNGHIDLTRRANLQIRGMTVAGLNGLQDVVMALGLVDEDARSEAVRNVMVAPLAGIDAGEVLDVRPLARALESRLAADTVLRDLPSKFGFLVDGGGKVSIAGERADISLSAVGQGIAIGIDTRAGTRWLGRVAIDAAIDTTLAAARAFLGVCRPRERLRDVDDERVAQLLSVVSPLLSPFDGDVSVASSRPLGAISLGAGRFAVGVAAAFGRLEARQLANFVIVAAAAGATELRLSPWRSFYVEVGDRVAARRLIDAAVDIGLIVEAKEPILRIDACPGAPACRSSSVDTRRDARRLASLGFKGTIHVSGCAKGCARSAPADVVLVGDRGCYEVIRNGTTHDVPERVVALQEVEALFRG